MATRIYAFDVEAKAGTTAEEPQTTPTEFHAGVVEELEILFPDGCAGLVGVQIANAYGQIIPYDGGKWIRGNSEVLKLPLEGYVESGSWQVIVYNTDIYAHTLQVRYLVHEVKSTEAAQGVEEIPASQIEPPRNLEQEQQEVAEEVAEELSA